MSGKSDLDDVLRLKAQLALLPDGPYQDSHGHPSRHPAGIYATSMGKVLQRMCALTDAVRVEMRPEAIRQGWPEAITALESLFAAIDSHVHDLSTIIGIVATDPRSRKAKQAIRIIDDIFEELVGRPYNQVRHHGQTLEVRSCSNADLALYGYFVSGPRADGVIAASRDAHGTTGSHWSFPVSVRRLIGMLIRAAQIVNGCLPELAKAPLPEWDYRDAEALRAIFDWVHRSPAQIDSARKINK